jgi:hypothetical protein
VGDLVHARGSAEQSKPIKSNKAVFSLLGKAETRTEREKVDGGARWF